MLRQLAKWYADQVTQAAILAGNPAPTPAQLLVDSTNRVFNLHPTELLRFYEEMWAYRNDAPERPDLQLPDRLLYGLSPGLESGLRYDLQNTSIDIFNPPVVGLVANLNGGSNADWQHLIYAYLIENTKIYEIFGRVLHEFRVGEKLEVPRETTQRWLRVTEDLFFRDLPSGSIAALTSSIRPDLGAIRRNAYYRLFGVDLNHGRPDGTPYPYVQAAAANNQFISTFEDFLREVWIAAENFKNSSGANPTDDAAIANFARDMQDMLVTRRARGNLAREEFAIVSMFSWFHFALESDNQLVEDLKANASSPEERLRKIGERVSLLPHRQSEAFFRLSDLMSVLFKKIEKGDYSVAVNVPALYTSPGATHDDMLEIINQWSVATGRDMKARRTTVTPRVVVNANRNGQKPALVGTRQ